jgi:hypothetical protein
MMARLKAGMVVGLAVEDKLGWVAGGDGGCGLIKNVGVKCIDGALYFVHEKPAIAVAASTNREFLYGGFNRGRWPDRGG